MKELALAGYTFFREPEPWGRATTASALGHGALLALLFLFSQNVPTVPPPAAYTLTDVRFIEKPALPPPVETPPVPVGEGLGTGGGRGGMGGRAGGTRLSGTLSPTPGSANPNMANLVPVTSPYGSPKGQVITNMPMAGPIVGADQIADIGTRRGAIIPLAGRVEGPAGAAQPHPNAIVGQSAGPVLALNTETAADARQRHASADVPLISRSLAATPGSGGTGLRFKGLPGLSDQARAKIALENLKPNPHQRDEWGKNKGPFSMEGPLKYRKILKKELPPYPRWAEERGIEASVSYRLWVDPKGRVKVEMYLEKASGFAELDALAKDALSRFVFIPLPEGQTQEDEWGVATFRFELKK
jgi:TonB family protein